MAVVEVAEVVGAAAATAGKKPAKEKKVRVAKAPKEKKLPKGFRSSVPAHPPYFQMIKEAILALNEKTGSSPHAIAKFIEDKHKGVLPANFKKVLFVQLKNFTSKGKLLKVKASFKLSETGKKDEKKKVAKKPEKKPRETRKRKVSSEPATKKASKASSKPKRAPAKKAKSLAVSTKPRQPKSIKSPAAKRARKAAT